MPSRLAFKDLPAVVQFTSLLSLLLAWITIEETIIDRNGLDRYLPFYRVGAFCVYDFAVLVLLALIWLGLTRSRS